MCDQFLKILGLNLRRLREEAGLSQEALAALVGCHRNYVGLIERGERNPSIIRVMKICMALKVPIQELLINIDDHKWDFIVRSGDE